MRLTPLSLGAAVAAALFSAGPYASQQQQPTFRAGVEIFHLDVSVLDKNRRPVRGLTAADFTILEDGKPQKIIALSDVELPAARPPAAVWMRDVSPDVTGNQLSERRLFVMILDDANVAPDLIVRESVKRIGHLIVDRLAPMDLMAVVFTADNRRPQDFTNDRVKLHAVIDRFTRLGGFKGMYNEFAIAMGLETLVKAAEFMIDLPEQRKAMLYLGTGVPVDVAAASAPQLLTKDTDPGLVMKREVAIRAFQRTMAILATAERANVNVYAFDAAGLRPSWVTNINVEFMLTVAANTGGKAFINNNDFTPGVEQLFRENASYYILGYESVAEKGPGHWRRLEVKVNRPDVEVRARTRHYTDDPPPPKKGETPPTAATRALAGLLPNGDIPLQLTLAPFAIPGRDDLATVAAVLGIGGNQAATAGTLHDLELQVSAFDPEGRPRGSQTYHARAPIDDASANATVAELVARADLAPGAYELRLALHDAQANRSGSVYADVEVPDFAKSPLSLSGVLITSSAAIRSAPRDALAAIAAIQPTTTRAFATANRVSAFARIYQGGGAKAPLATVTVAVRIVDARDTEVFASTETYAPERFATRAADVRLDLPLARLQPGPHLLTIEARTGRTTVRRQVPFNVR